jgi:four helix bundle protein
MESPAGNFYYMQILDTLDVYLLAKEFRKEVVKIVNSFPKEEKYLLTAQIKDSARSITANIAEGYGRYYYQEAIQFCRIARGIFAGNL